MKKYYKAAKAVKKPVRHGRIPFYRPSLGREEELEIIDTIRSGWLGRGPKTEAFEDNFRRYVQSRYAVGVNSCTAGLHLSLIAVGVGRGDQVITSPMTFPATANAIVHQGAVPVFVDIRKDTFNIDFRKIEKKITPKTKAIIPVHFAGYPCEMNKIVDLAKKYNLFVIEDAAHALGGKYYNRKIGSIGDLTCFSFHATKTITTGEGGMVTTNHKNLADKIRLLSLHGISRDAWQRRKQNYFRQGEAVLSGFKYNMYDLQASLGLVQLKKIERFLKIKKRYTDMYNEGFCRIPEIVTPAKRNDVESACYLYLILVKKEFLSGGRKEIIKALWRENIEVGCHFKALHLHPFYKKGYGSKRGDFPIAEHVSDRVISLPLYPKMKESDIKNIISVMKKTVLNYRKKRYYAFKR